MQKDAECNGGSVTVCSGTSCEGDVNRAGSGAAACLSLVMEDKACGDKWFEVGDSKCYCYSPDQVDCRVVSDPQEDLYQIGETFLKIIVF